MHNVPFPPLYKYAYVGQPYSHAAPEIRQQRYEAGGRFVLDQLQKGFVCYSPILHSHNLAVMFPELIKTNFDFWRAADFAMLSKAHKMDVLMLPEWEKSYGLSEEIKFCGEHNIPIWYHDWPLVQYK